MRNGLVLIAILALLGLSFYGGYQYKGDTEIIKRDTITLTRIDTIKINVLKVVQQRIKDTILIEVTDTLRRNDTLYVPVIRTEKVYADTNYRAVVSGYKPSLDSLTIYQKTIFKTIEVYPKQRNWGVGVIGGVGVSDKLRPFIGVGLYYKLF